METTTTSTTAPTDTATTGSAPVILTIGVAPKGRDELALVAAAPLSQSAITVTYILGLNELGAEVLFTLPRELNIEGEPHTIEIEALKDVNTSIPFETHDDHFTLAPHTAGDDFDRFIKLKAVPATSGRTRRGSGHVRVREPGGGGDV